MRSMHAAVAVIALGSLAGCVPSAPLAELGVDVNWPQDHDGLRVTLFDPATGAGECVDTQGELARDIVAADIARARWGDGDDGCSSAHAEFGFVFAPGPVDQSERPFASGRPLNLFVNLAADDERASVGIESALEVPRVFGPATASAGAPMELRVFASAPWSLEGARVRCDQPFFESALDDVTVAPGTVTVTLPEALPPSPCTVTVDAVIDEAGACNGLAECRVRVVRELSWLFSVVGAAP